MNTILGDAQQTMDASRFLEWLDHGIEITKQEGEKPWGERLIGYYYGRRAALEFVKETVESGRFERQPLHQH